MNKLIRQWMTPDPITINGDNTLSIAYNLMRLNNVRRLPVVDDDEKLIGIITWGDVREARPKSNAPKTEDAKVANATWEEHFLAATRDVRDFMTPAPHHVTPDELVYTAAALMVKHKISGLPVVEDGRIVGIVTEVDLFKFIIDNWPEVEDELPWNPERVA